MLSIAKLFYSEYLLFFLFDNITNYSVYAKDIFQVKDINKRCGGK